jgi:hypothetical protein
MLKASSQKMGKLFDHHQRRSLVVNSDVRRRMLGWMARS